jgi:hypothetical protein
MRRAYRAGAGPPVGRGPGAGGDLDAEGALEVGATDLGAELLEHREHVGVGVPVAVVCTDADHRDRRVSRPEERRVRGRSAVVRDGEEVDVELRGVAQQVGLRGALRVTGEQDPTVVGRRGAHDDRRLVQLAALVPVRTPRRWTEHLQRQRADRHPIARHDVADRHAPLMGDRQELGRLGQLGRDGPVPDRPHLEPPEHLRSTPDVVEVAVADDEQVERAPTVLPQPAGRGPVLTRIDQHARTGRLEQEGVTLPDVDGGQRQRRREGAAGHVRDERGAEEDEARHERSSREPGPRRREQPPADGDERQHRERAGEVGPALEPLERLGDDEHHPRRRPGQRHHEPASWGVEQPDGAADEGQHGGDGSRRDGHQVRRDGSDRQLTEAHEEHRHDRDLGTDRDGGELSRPSREPRRQVGADTRGRHQYPRGGRGRQQQPEGSGQQRVDQHEHEHRAGERMTRIARDAPHRRREQQQGHRPRALHAGLEPRHEREPRHHQQDRDPTSSRADPGEREEPHDPTHHDRDVAPRHRREVREARHLHGLAVLRREQPRVAGHEPDQQATGPFVELAGGDVADPRPHVLARPGEASRRRDRLPGDDVQHDARVLPSQPPAVPAVG